MAARCSLFVPIWGPEMGNALPTGTRGRLLAVAITLLGVAVVWLAITSPLMQWHAERADALVQRTALLGRMDSLVALREALQHQALSVKADGAGDATLLEGDSDSIASATMQELLQAVLSRAGVQLNSVETLPAEAADGYRRIRLRVSFAATWPVLMALLKEIELATPVLLIDELQIEPALHRMSTAPGSFDVSCAMFGFRSERARVASQ
jgi:hypothetical protein